MKRCAFLSMESLEGFFSYDQLLVEPLRLRGWEVTFVPWRSEVNWSELDAVVIRTPWDYYLHPEEFVTVLETIASQTVLENPLDVVLWNLDKRYLLDLQRRGVEIVPTLIADPAAPDGELGEAVRAWRASAIVVKPAIGANAADIHRLEIGSDADQRTLEHLISTSRRLIQPFIDSVISEGELSLFYFGGRYSHAVSKVPASGDYRVQEEHGGRLRSIEPDAGARSTADRAVSAVRRDLLYARVDLVRHEDRWLLMELELIEPSLYFNMDPESPERFARVFSEWFS